MAKYKDIKIRIRVGAETLLNVAGQEQKKPEQKKPEQNKPEQNKPEQNKPEQNKAVT